MQLPHTFIENSLRYLKTIKYQNFQKKSLLYSILNIPTFRQSVTASPERMQHRTQNNGFYGCKIEKFVRDLKNLSHSYLKQPLARVIKYKLQNNGRHLQPNTKTGSTATTKIPLSYIKTLFYITHFNFIIITFTSI